MKNKLCAVWLRFRIARTTAKLNRAQKLVLQAMSELNEADRVAADVSDELEFLKKKLARKENKHAKVT